MLVNYQSIYNSRTVRLEHILFFIKSHQLFQNSIHYIDLKKGRRHVDRLVRKIFS